MSRSRRKTRIKRLPERGAYDAESIAAVLDRGLLCHVAFEFDGEPALIPTLYWRDGAALYFHGSIASRMMRSIVDASVCIGITLLDGIVYARSAFHHSMNYRSAVIYGVARRVESASEKERQLRLMMEKLSPGRWSSLRPVKSKELKATQVMYVDLSEASVKSRSGPPSENESDLEWPVWAGVVPLETVARGAVPDQFCNGTYEAPGVPLYDGLPDVE